MGMTRRIAVACVSALLLAGCTAQDTLAPENQSAAGTPSLTPPRTGPLTPGEPGLGNARVRFAPIVGSTVEAVTPMSRRISVRAREAGMVIVPADDPAQTHLVKGYFSALADAGQTTVIFVWDILDSAGDRLHRIQGQEVAPDAADPEDPWRSVPVETMERIGDRMMSELTAWLAAHPA
ncbi:MAG: hypothetical protein R3D65_12955 [Zhengella sp.]|uniref:hypothetical protein n=1 Tax=Zhengella sp. TaxID=2282762 RepID=UPI003528329B